VTFDWEAVRKKGGHGREEHHEKNAKGKKGRKKPENPWK